MIPFVLLTMAGLKNNASIDDISKWVIHTKQGEVNKVLFTAK
jgi:hypothetical protein